ncbi:unnamed protein product, partial [Prorocentrum cordatum]
GAQGRDREAAAAVAGPRLLPRGGGPRAGGRGALAVAPRRRRWRRGVPGGEAAHGRHEGLRESRAALTIHLADIERLIKGGEQPGAELATAGRRHTRRQSAGATQATDRLLSRLEYNASLTFIGKSAELVRLIFDTPAARDRAYTCFRILQISAQAAEPFAAA